MRIPFENEKEDEGKREESGRKAVTVVAIVDTPVVTETVGVETAFVIVFVGIGLGGLRGIDTFIFPLI